MNIGKIKGDALVLPLEMQHNKSKFQWPTIKHYFTILGLSVSYGVVSIIRLGWASMDSWLKVGFKVCIANGSDINSTRVKIGS